MPKNLGTRLTVLYVALTASSLLFVFLLTYLLVRQNLLYRVDDSLRNESVEFAALVKSQGQQLLSPVLDEESASEGTDKMFIRVVDPSGVVIYTSPMESWPDMPIVPRGIAAARRGEYYLESAKPPTKDAPVRIIYAPFPEGNVLQMGQSMGDDTHLLETLWIWFSAALVAMLGVSGLIGWLMSRRATAGIRSISIAAHGIAEGHLDQRVVITDHDDEVAEVARTFNTMLDRIQNSLKDLLEVTDNVAHDLRSPIMRIRGEAEGALLGGATTPALETLAGNILEECDRLLGLINTMLEISETEAGAVTLETETFDLAIVTHDICDMYQAVAEDKGIKLSCEAQPSVTTADRRKLMRAIVQLVDNAVKYSQQGDRVRVVVNGDTNTIRIAVHDTGQGVPPDERDAIFSRFYRVERSRNAPGNGLGLSLALALVRAHGGAIGIECVDENGSTFTITLPRNTRNPF